jgi:hypothetical protein
MSRTYLGANLIGSILENLPDSFDGSSCLEELETTCSNLVLKLRLGLLVQFADHLIHGLLHLGTGKELGWAEGDTLGVLSRE